MEIAFYCANDTLADKKHVDSSINNLLELIPQQKTYCTPIKEQWGAYTEQIKYNFLLVDLDNNNCVLCYSTNKLTKRVSGVCIMDYKISDLHYLISKCTFNLEIFIIFVNFSIKEEITYKNSRAKNSEETEMLLGKKSHKEIKEIKKRNKIHKLQL